MSSSGGSRRSTNPVSPHEQRLPPRQEEVECVLTVEEYLSGVPGGGYKFRGPGCRSRHRLCCYVRDLTSGVFDLTGSR